MLFSVYTEAAVALPLSLAGGYVGGSALRRLLQSCRFWMDLSGLSPVLSSPPGSAGRATAMRVRVMHRSVRRRVAQHPEWDAQRWGLPVSQSYTLLTQLAGGVAPTRNWFAAQVDGRTAAFDADSALRH